MSMCILPVSISIYLKPSAVKGPQVVLHIRDYLCQTDCPRRVRNLFIKHAKTWLVPETAALCLLDEDGPQVDQNKLPMTEPNLEKLLWSNKPVQKFLCQTSLASPCLTRGSPNKWRSFKNNNMSCERLVGSIGSRTVWSIKKLKIRGIRIVTVLLNQWTRGSKDF